MPITFKPVEEIPGNRGRENRELFEAFLASGAQFAELTGLSRNDRSRLQSATQSFNRTSTNGKVAVRSRGEATYIERL